jgi:putative peptidoglycan lipid II flippase
MELPQGMFGISLATYMLPTLAGLAAQKKYPEFRQTLGQGLGYLAFANLFAAAIALSLAEPIVRLLFERGKFGPGATYRVAMALACLAPGLLMFSMNNILARAFYALDDIKTPMKISIVCLGLNLAFGLWLVRPYKEIGLGVANTLSATFNVVLLTYALRRKLTRIGLAELARTLLVLVPAAALAGVIAALLSHFWVMKLGVRTLPLKLGDVFVPGAVAGLIYWLLALYAKVPAAKETADLIRQRFGRKPAPQAEGKAPADNELPKPRT